MKYLALLLITMISVASSCQKEESKSPSWHVDVFRCKVNGEEWTPKCISDPLFGCSAVDCQYYWQDTKTLSLSAVRRENNDLVYQSMRLYKYQSEFGDNVLGHPKREYKDWNKPAACIGHDMDTTSVRRLTILEVDTVNFLIKGTFEFTAINDCQDTMHITDGYFHVNFRF
ncbi:MAG: hypothetical protein KA479_09480 [Saprospiraceae bacterium]|nr:hypothetical protein [Saprospiraceae bacterium]MBP6185160.1 hypothetical protein [Saprospiraceae bacterium]